MPRDQVAFITGGASGIGRALAAALVREGARVAIGDINPEIDAVARDLGAAMGVRVDVTDPLQVETAIEGIVRAQGGLHILGNVAGVYRRATVADMTPKQWDETLDANLKSAFLCSHFALPPMLRQRYGRIVSIASGLGVRGAARSSAYAASKAGLMAFSTPLSQEVFDQGVTVNCIAPGITETPLMRKANTPEEIQTAVARSGRPLGQPDDVVAPFLFLISDGAQTISGVTLWMRNPRRHHRVSEKVGGATRKMGSLDRAPQAPRACRAPGNPGIVAERRAGRAAPSPPHQRRGHGLARGGI
jgi:3-oxoacyl-[acyl-carrier protein] reductase